MRYLILVIGFLSFTQQHSLAQKSYSISFMELIFTSGKASYTSDFSQLYPDAEVSKNNIRFTAFYHAEKDWHFDLTQHLGFFGGIGIRNIGMSTNEILPLTIEGDQMRKYKIVKRVYTGGIPVAVKFGNLSDRFFLYAGGELEMAFHYKEKYWSDTHKRSGTKLKNSVWFGSQTPTFLPSLIGGIQLANGINLRLKYYFRDFLNSEYTVSHSEDMYNLSDLSRYSESGLFYLSVSWQLKREDGDRKNIFEKKDIVNI